MSERLQVLSYGGGRQTIAICVLIAKGILPRPDRVVMADTGREARSTFDYLDTHIRPLLRPLCLEVEIAPHSLATVDLYGKNGDLLIPIWTETGRFSGWCSGEWKRAVRDRYLKTSGVSKYEAWIGFALDERRRVLRMLQSNREEPSSKRFPLVELMLTTADCVRLVVESGLPEPPISSCWMCPHRTNKQWAALTPEEFAQAVEVDRELREEDLERGGSGVYLHHSRAPLELADLTVIERPETVSQCGLGMCFV